MTSPSTAFSTQLFAFFHGIRVISPSRLEPTQMALCLRVHEILVRISPTPEEIPSPSGFASGRWRAGSRHDFCFVNVCLLLLAPDSRIRPFWTAVGPLKACTASGRTTVGMTVQFLGNPDLVSGSNV